MNQTCRTLLEKQGRAHKWCTPMDTHIWLGKNRTTSSNIHTATMWGCSPEDLPDAMNCREKWRERVRDIHACSKTWWWWWWWFLFEIKIFMYHTHLRIMYITNFSDKIQKKNLKCIIHIDLVEYVAAKFKLHLIFLQLLIWFVLT